MSLWALLAALAGAAAPARAVVPPPVEAAHDMVVSAERLASEAGLDMLRAGGNAVDAAVATGYALTVVDPCCGNIGGGGFMVLRLATGVTRFIDFRETAPAASTPDMYLDASGHVVPDASLAGWKAAGVPGTVLGLDTALREYGTLPREAVMAPAIRLARDGFALTRTQAALLASRAGLLRRDSGAARIFLRADGTPFQAGDRLVQPDLARTLAAIAARGADAFYRGAVPDAIEAASSAGGGVLTASDLARYRITEGAPLTCAYRGLVLISTPPPSSGGTTLCEILNIVEGYDLARMGYHSASSIHVLVEAMRHAFLDKNTRLGDPAFEHNPVDQLLSKDYAAAIRATIRPERATPSAELGPLIPPHERPETTHYSVVDRRGNAVAVTYTLNGAFGAGVVAPNTGFLLNDEMDDFTIRADTPNAYGLVQGARNRIAPGKRPLSAMAPTIVTRDGKLYLVLGSPGGPRIITAVLQTLINIVDYGMDPQEAVDAPRLHHQFLPDQIFAEPDAVSSDTTALLKERGYSLKVQTPWSAVELIEVAPERPQGSGPAAPANDSMQGLALRPGFLYGANDDRRPDGAALGD